MKNLISVLLLFVSFQAWSQADVNERVGYARAMDNGELLYTESHYEVFESGVIVSDKVTYKDANGKVIAEKQVDYSRNQTMPDFKLVNFETGHKEIVNKRTSEVEVIFTKNAEAGSDSKVIALPVTGIIDAGFDRFVVEHWDELTGGQVMVRGMLIPSMKKFIDFRIYQDSIDDQNNKRILKVEPDSIVYRFLADPLILEYDIDRPRLYTFTGTSNMRNAYGDNLKVSITFPAEETRISRN